MVKPIATRRGFIDMNAPFAIALCRLGVCGTKAFFDQTYLCAVIARLDRAIQ